MKVKIEVKYEAGHSYHEVWEKSEYFCPHCAQQTVWGELSEGDYYVGPSFLCLACGEQWTWQLDSGSGENFQIKQRLEELRRPR